MEYVIVVGILVGLGAWVYHSGKRRGSRSGYAAGRFRRQRR